MESWKKKFYFSKQWKECSKSFLESKAYICERCGEAAVLSHHRIYLTAQNVSDYNISLNWKNLEALCLACHNKEHFGESESPRYTVDAYGRVQPKEIT